MLTVMVHAKVKKEKLDEYLDLIKMLSEKTTKKGCKFYTFNQNKDDPTDFVLYEQWESQTDLDNHIKELFEILGPARPGQPTASPQSSPRSAVQGRRPVGPGAPDPSLH